MNSTFLPKEIILDKSKFIAFVGNKLKVSEMTIFVFDRVENIMEKGENVGY